MNHTSEYFSHTETKQAIQKHLRVFNRRIAYSMQHYTNYNDAEKVNDLPWEYIVFYFELAEGLLGIRSFDSIAIVEKCERFKLQIQRFLGGYGQARTLLPSSISSGPANQALMCLAKIQQSIAPQKNGLLGIFLKTEVEKSAYHRIISINDRAPCLIPPIHNGIEGLIKL